MARPGVTYSEVAKAAEALLRQGHNPTVDGLRAALGTGSKSTIAPFLKRWKAGQAEGVETGLPEDLLASVKGVYGRLQQLADDKIAEAQGDAESLATALRGELAQAQGTVDELHARRQGLEKRVETLEAENQGFYVALEAERVTTAKLETALGETTERLTEAKATLGDQKQEIGQIRAHFEHYQTSVADDRQQEREQRQSIKTQLENRIQELSQALKDEAGRYQRLEAINERTEEALTQLREQYEAVKQEAQVRQLEVVRKENALKQRESEAAALREQGATLEAQSEAFSKEKSELVIAKRLLEEEGARLNREGSEAHDKIALLTDENRIAGQEKANLQGQLKQLQRHL